MKKYQYKVQGVDYEVEIAEMQPSTPHLPPPREQHLLPRLLHQIPLQHSLSNLW